MSERIKGKLGQRQRSAAARLQVKQKPLVAFKGHVEGEFKVRDGLLSSPYQLLNIWAGDVVLDLGANVGLFARWASARHAAKVVSVEPHPANLRALRKNVDPKIVEIIPAAVVGHDQREVTLYESSSPACHTIYPRPRLKPLTVPAISLKTLLDRAPFTIVKCDIEGGEWEIFKQFPVMPSVRALAIELHYYGQATQTPARQLLERITAAGWRVVRRPTIKLQWNSIGIWFRR